VSPLDLVLGTTGTLLLATLLAGLVYRGQVRRAPAFFLLIAASLCWSVLVAADRERFWQLDYWLAKEWVHALLRVAVVLEIAQRTFLWLPGARRAAGLAMLGAASMTAVSFALLPPLAQDRVSYLASAGLACVLQGSVWLFMAISAVVVSYRVPLDCLTKAILVGYTPYLLIFTIGSSASAALGWDQARALQFHPPVYVALLAYWNQVVWAHGQGREHPLAAGIG
jgi:hypothetical protein